MDRCLQHAAPRPPLALIRTFGLALCLALACLTGAPAAEPAPQCTALPDTRGWKPLGERPVRYPSGAKTLETTIAAYEKDGIRLLVARFKGKDRPFAFWRHDIARDRPFDRCMDLDGDGVFESYSATDFKPAPIDEARWGLR